jgi:hypothetical protein
MSNKELLKKLKRYTATVYLYAPFEQDASVILNELQKRKLITRWDDLKEVEK